MPSPDPENTKKVPTRGAASNPKRQCVATRVDGQRCTQWAIKGGTVCRKHGGAATQVKNAAARRYEREQATEIMTKAVATYGLSRNIGPEAALMEELHRTAGHVAWLEAVIQSLETGDLKQYSRQTAGLVFERPAVWLEMYQSERSHFLAVCKTAIAAGIKEREIRIAEEQSQLFVRMIRGILNDLHLTEEQQEEAPSIVRRHLTLVREAS